MKEKSWNNKNTKVYAMQFVSELFDIRSREQFSANDITVWLIRVLEEFFDIEVSRIRTEVYIKKGKRSRRADIVVQDSIGIETKSFLEREIDEAERQVKYLLQKFEAEGDISPVGIATDGQHWRFYVLADGELYNFFSFVLNENSRDSELKDNLWTGITALRHQIERPAPTARLIAETFKPSGPVFNESRAQLVTQIKHALYNNPTRFTSKFLPWYELFSFVYNNFEDRCKSISDLASDLDDIVNKLKILDDFPSFDDKTLRGSLELFIRHTYLVLIAKTLSALVTLGEERVTELVLSDPQSIVTGKAVYDEGVHISDPDDFFVWPAEDSRKLIGSLLKPLQRFSDKYTEDVFRRLYEIVVDPETRHELGEFFTPKWIAQLIVQDTIFDARAKVLDPACGSGTFLVYTLKKKMELLKREKRDINSSDIESLLDETWGIDVNPLSVILARTNIYLTIAFFLKGREQPAEIKPRIYVADTFILPRFNEVLLEGESRPVIHVEVTPRISIPVLPTLDPDEAIQHIEMVSEALEQGLNKLPDEVMIKGEIAEYCSELLKSMKRLRTLYGDNLWRYILRNYGIPPLLRHKFDVVLGNPPWLSFREARAHLKSIMERIATQYNIKPPVQVKTSFNLAVAFFLAASEFVKTGGLIGFVFPLSVLDSPAHLSFIKLLTSNEVFSLKTAYDLSGISPSPFPHNLPCSILIAEVCR